MECHDRSACTEADELLGPVRRERELRNNALLIPKGKEPEDYSAWASKVGESSGLGGEMMLSICYSADGETDWVIRGIVGVPGFPEDDMERHIAATKLAENGPA